MRSNPPPPEHIGEGVEAGLRAWFNAGMDQMRVYEYLERSRAWVLDRVRERTEEEHRRDFAIGPGSLARTLTHIVVSEWYYVERMLRRDVPRYEEWTVRDENPPPFAALEAMWSAQARETRSAIGRIGDWDRRIVYRVIDDAGREIEVTTTARDLFTQLMLHEVHHRAQILQMLRRLGVEAAELDFNALMFERRVVGESAPG